MPLKKRSQVKKGGKPSKSNTKTHTKPHAKRIEDVDVDYGVDDLVDSAGEPIEDLEEVDDIPDLAVIDPLQTLKEKYEYHPKVQHEIVFVHPDNRITSEVNTLFEIGEIMSTRAKQIENGGTCFTDVGELSDPLAMAKKELLDKRCPLDVIREITDKVYERWHVNEMALPAGF